MKKRFFAAALAAMCLVTGCSGGVAKKGSDDKAGENSGVVKLTVWAEEDNFSMMEGMIDSFKKNYPEQKFEIALVHNADAELRNNLLQDIHADVDVFSFPDDQFDSLMSAGVLSQVPDDCDAKTANVAGAVEAATYKDRLFAYPYTADNGYFMYYNKKYLTEEDMKSLDRILEVANSKGKKVSMELNSGWYMYAFYAQTGLDFGINDDGVTNHCNWNATDTEIKGIDVAQSIQNFVNNAAFENVPDGDFVSKLKSDEVIAGVSGTWNATGVEEAWGKDYGAVKLPTFTCAGKQIQMGSFTGYKMFGVNAYSDEQEWAHKLAQWLTNEENQTIRFEQKSQGPSNIKASESDAVLKVPAISAVIDQSQYGNLQRVGNKFWDPCTNFINTLIDGNPGNTSLQDLIDTMTNGITASTTE